MYNNFKFCKNCIQCILFCALNTNLGKRSKITFKYNSKLNNHQINWLNNLNIHCRFYFDVIVGSVEIFKEPTVLVGHRAKISCIALSQAFSIAVSCDNEGFSIIWDLNDTSYVRSLNSMSSPVINYFETFSLV